MLFLISFTVVIVGAFLLFAILKEDKGSRDYENKNKTTKKVISWIAVSLEFLILGLNSLIIVPVGSVYVATLFGSIQKEVYSEGFHVINPLLNLNEMSVRRTAIQFGGEESESGDRGMISQSSNNVPLTVDATFAFSLNPVYANWVFQKMGLDDAYVNSLIVPVTRSAVRSSVPKFTSEEATTSKREELAVVMREEFIKHLVSDLVSQGLDQSVASEVFVILPVQVRKVLPPAKVLNAIAEKAAEDENLAKQITLTAVAKEEAERRANEGAGIAKLFEQLPSGFKPEEIAQIINAISNNTKATAFLKGVENGSINTIVIDGSPTGVPLASNKN